MEKLEEKHDVLGFLDEKRYKCPKCNSKLIDAGSSTIDEYVFWCSNKNCEEYKEHFYGYGLDEDENYHKFIIKTSKGKI